jgi:hypothetical protein
MNSSVSILQTGRLGDLWYTAPLAKWYYDQGRDVEVVYDGMFGNPFAFFPYIKPRPVHLRRYCSTNVGWGHFYNEAIWQIFWFAKCHVSKSLLIFCATLFGQYPAQMTTVKDPVDPADTAVRAGTQVRPASN